jgi:hypothetical protein
VNVTAWSDGLKVTGGGTGVVSHAGLGLLRCLPDRAGLTGGLSQALWSGRVLGHDRGRVLADSACVIADGARAISGFRVLSDQAEEFGQVASVPTAYRTLEEISKGGAKTEKKLIAAVNKARRQAWGQGIARHGKLPGVRVADKALDGVTCIRLDATVTFAHSQGARRGEFQGIRPSSAASRGSAASPARARRSRSSATSGRTDPPPAGTTGPVGTAVGANDDPGRVAGRPGVGKRPLSLPSLHAVHGPSQHIRSQRIHDAGPGAG